MEKVYKTGFKGFEQGMKCLDKQYAENEIFEEENARICESGMHFCENPLEVFKYYNPCKNGKFNEFAKVEALDECDTNDDKKFCTRKLKVGAKLKFGDFVKLGVEYAIEKADKDRKQSTSGYCSGASTSGDYSGASTSGNYSGASTSGDYSGASTSGYYSGASTSGNYSGASTSGNYSGAMAVGDNCNASCDKNSIAICVGKNGKCKGALGSFIILTEWDDDRHITDCKSVKVDGKTIKADTYYNLVDGEFAEVE